MKLTTRFKSFFAKLIITYIALTVISTLILGTVTYNSFSSSFNSEIMHVNQRMLDNLQRLIDESVIRKVEQIYIDIVANESYSSDITSLFYENKSDSQHANFVKVNRHLTNLTAANSDMVHSIEIYYKNENISISSHYGVKYLNSDLKHTFIDFSWIERFKKSEKTTQWTAPCFNVGRYDSEDSTILSFHRVYPSSPNENILGIVAINLREDYISNFIKKYEYDENKYFFIVDSFANIMSHSITNRINDDVRQIQYVKDILNSSKKSGHLLAKSDDLDSMISYTSFEYTDWKLLQVSPVYEFYIKSLHVQRLIIIACLVNVVIGTLIAYVFTYNMYNPIKVLVQKINAMFTDEHTQKKKKEITHEYAYINSAIDQLASEVNKLTYIVKRNQPLIEHNLVIRLLNNTIKNRNELDELLGMLKVSFAMEYYKAIIIEFSEQYIKNISIENSHFLKFSLIEHISEMSSSQALYMGAELTVNRIGIIANLKFDNKGLINRFIESVKEFLAANFYTAPVFAVGSEVDDVLKLWESLRSAEILLKYRYFIPQKNIYISDEILYRENSNEEIAESIVTDFQRGLNLRDTALIKNTLMEFTRLTSEGCYSATHCHQRVIGILAVFSRFVKNLGYDSHEILEGNLNEQFESIENIDQLQEWLLLSVDKTFAYINNKAAFKNTDIIEKVKDFIESHLHLDISLCMVSEKVFLSDKYLSKIFKEETGINFSDYVNQKRIEKAEELIVNTDLSVNDIAIKVGFHSSAYFINKFKEVYGMTPKSYKVQKAMKLD